MANPEIETKIIELVAKQFATAKEKVKPETAFKDDLGADSLDSTELIMELEDAFDMSIPDEAALEIKTVADAIAYVEKHPKQQPSS